MVKKKVKLNNSLPIFTSRNRKAKVKKLQGLKALTLEPWSRWPCFSGKHSLTSLLPCSLFCCVLLFPLFRTLQQSTMRLCACTFYKQKHKQKLDCGSANIRQFLSSYLGRYYTEMLEISGLFVDLSNPPLNLQDLYAVELKWLTKEV